MFAVMQCLIPSGSRARGCLQLLTRRWTAIYWRVEALTGAVASVRGSGGWAMKPRLELLLGLDLNQSSENSGNVTLNHGLISFSNQRVSNSYPKWTVLLARGFGGWFVCSVWKCLFTFGNFSVAFICLPARKTRRTCAQARV